MTDTDFNPDPDNITGLRHTIESAFKRRGSLIPEEIEGSVRPAVEEVLDGLESGHLRVAEPGDGAHGWQLHRYITLPMLSSTTQTNAVLIIVGSLKFFDLVWILTTGGPSNATEMVATYMFKQAFQSNAWGYGSTLAFVLFLVVFVIALVFRAATSRRSEEGV